MTLQRKKKSWPGEINRKKKWCLFHKTCKIEVKYPEWLPFFDLSLTWLISNVALFIHLQEFSLMLLSSHRGPFILPHLTFNLIVKKCNFVSYLLIFGLLFILYSSIYHSKFFFSLFNYYFSFLLPVEMFEVYLEQIRTRYSGHLFHKYL